MFFFFILRTGGIGGIHESRIGHLFTDRRKGHSQFANVVKGSHQQRAAFGFENIGKDVQAALGVGKIGLGVLGE